MKRRARNIYTDAQKADIWNRWQNGETMHEIARSFDRYHGSVRGILTANGGIRQGRESAPHWLRRWPNEKPCKTLGFETPADRLNACLVSSV